MQNNIQSTRNARIAQHSASIRAAQMSTISVQYTLLRFQMALAILSLFRGVGDSWAGSRGVLVALSGAGRTTVRAFLRELECLGYIAVGSYGGDTTFKYTLLRPLQLTHDDGTTEVLAPDGHELDKLRLYARLRGVIAECEADGIDPAAVLQRAMDRLESDTLH